MWIWCSVGSGHEACGGLAPRYPSEHSACRMSCSPAMWPPVLRGPHACTATGPGTSWSLGWVALQLFDALLDSSTGNAAQWELCGLQAKVDRLEGRVGALLSWHPPPSQNAGAPPWPWHQPPNQNTGAAPGPTGVAPGPDDHFEHVRKAQRVARMRSGRSCSPVWTPPRSLCSPAASSAGRD